MGLVVLGLSHKTAPVELREHLAIPKDRLAAALKHLHGLDELKETVVLSTCNRLEIYARPENTKAQTLKSLRDFFAQTYTHLKLDAALYQHEGAGAVHHLFRVASGLDSLVVGESEVLGQVKSSYAFAQEQGVTGKITNVLFQRALYVGKHVRSHTNLSKGSSSVGSIAVHLAERIFGSLENHKILLLGAGKMAEVTARHLLSQKAGKIKVLNRTLAKAQALADLLNGVAGPLGDMEAELIEADIVLCSVASDEPILRLDQMQKIMREREDRSIYFVDIAVPRNVDPRIHELDNAYVYNIDDLQEIVDENMGMRKKDVQEAERVVAAFSKEFYEWVQAVLEGKSIALTHDLSKHPL